MQIIYEWCCILGIKQLTFISNISCKFNCPIITLKEPIVTIIKKKQGNREIINYCKGEFEINKNNLVRDNADLLISIGRKGMQMRGIPINYLYSSEIYHMSKVNLLQFFYQIRHYSESEQRNGR